MERIDTMRLIVEQHQARLIDNMWVDVQTANLLIRIWEHLKPELRIKFEEMPLLRLVDFAWSRVA